MTKLAVPVKRATFDEGHVPVFAGCSFLSASGGEFTVYSAFLGFYEVWKKKLHHVKKIKNRTTEAMKLYYMTCLWSIIFTK